MSLLDVADAINNPVKVGTWPMGQYGPSIQITGRYAGVVPNLAGEVVTLWSKVKR